MKQQHATFCPPNVLRGNTLKLLGFILGRRYDPPSVREMMKLCGIRSTNGINVHLLRLRNLGLITWDVEKKRTVHSTCKVEVVSCSNHSAATAGAR